MAGTSMWRSPRKAPAKNAVAAAKVVVVLKEKNKENEALTNLPEVETKVAGVQLMRLREVEEDHLTQEQAGARERRAVAAAAALKVLLKEEDQKSNFLKPFGIIFPCT